MWLPITRKTDTRSWLIKGNVKSFSSCKSPLPSRGLRPDRPWWVVPMWNFLGSCWGQARKSTCPATMEFRSGVLFFVTCVPFSYAKYPLCEILPTQIWRAEPSYTSARPDYIPVALLLAASVYSVACSHRLLAECTTTYCSWPYFNTPFLCECRHLGKRFFARYVSPACILVLWRI